MRLYSPQRRPDMNELTGNDQTENISVVRWVPRVMNANYSLSPPRRKGGGGGEEEMILGHHLCIVSCALVSTIQGWGPCGAKSCFSESSAYYTEAKGPGIDGRS